VHVVYGGAHLFQVDVAPKLGARALGALQEYAPDAAVFAKAVGLPERLADQVYARVLEKLRREPVEDYRIDFEDGYGNRPDKEEDGHAAQAAVEIARGMRSGELAPFIGIRVKPFSEEQRARSIRTLDIFLSTLVKKTGRKLPSNFVVTLPKVSLPEQVAALADLFDLLERAVLLPRGSLRMEVMIETTQSILTDRGESNLPLLVKAARGRCVAAHFGTYDYTAACSITAAHQHMLHPACDFAKHMMQVALAGTGIWLSDGATNIMPVPPHRPEKGGALSPRQIEENRAVVHRAWKLHYDQDSAFAHERLLPGLGPPPGAASDALRGRVCLLSGGPGSGV
jgi:citrate lyase beta subunit